MQIVKRISTGFAGLTAAMTLAVLTTQVQAQPDFSGAWTTYRGTPVAGAFTAPPGGPKLKPEAQ